MTRSRRTLVAAVLVVIAVAIPTSAWYVAGVRDARRTAHNLEQRALDEVGRASSLTARRLADRLEELRVAESTRPFYHYQNLYHDPQGVAQGLSVLPSPLARGAQDPLVWGHFQIDPDGTVSVPTVNEDFPELSADQGFSTYCTFLETLQGGLIVAAGELASSGDDPSSPSEIHRASSDPALVLELDRKAWQQILEADTVYATLTGRHATPNGVLDDGRARVADLGPVVVRVGSLRWHTVVFDTGPVLAALREVVTPSGPLVQGFAIANQTITRWIETGEHSVFSPGASTDPLRPVTAVGDTGWFIEADARPGLAVARREARDVTRRFFGVFTMTALAALLAGAAVVFIVAQTDRLARQRAAFAAAAAHELRTPLAGLQLHSEMLMEDLGDPASRGRYAERVSTEVARLGRLVSNMLDLSQLERGAISVNPREGHLDATVRDCVRRVQPSLEDAGLQVQLGSLTPVVASFDPDAVCQILHNLLDNAEKYTRGLPGRAVEIRLGADAQEVRVTVADNGSGISSTGRRRLFKPFARAVAAEAPAGLGLGLAVARALAVAQHGRLELDEDVPFGTSITLILPPPGAVS